MQLLCNMCFHVKRILTQAEQLSFHYPYRQGTLKHKLEVKYLMGMHICWLQLLGNYIINSFRRYELGLDKIEHNGEFKMRSCMCVCFG